MNKKEKIIIFAIGAVILIIITILMVLKIRKEENIPLDESKGGYQPTLPDGIDLEKRYDIEKLRNATKFFTIEKCIQNFLKDDNQYSEKEFSAKKMDVIYSPTEIYRVYGCIENEEKYFIAKIDNSNFTFEINTCEDRKYSKLEDIPIEQSNEEIPATENNKLEYVRLSDEDISRKYQRYYTDLLLNEPEEAYEMLDEEYRKKRFSDFDDFKKYIEDNKEAIEQASLAAYSVDMGDDTTEYVLKNSYGQYYLISEDSIMNFKIKLDNYTITDDEFAEKYKNLKEAEKASANVGIFIQMINNKDYSHAYEKLSEGFKNNYFKTQEDFEEYIKSNWYYINDYDINRYSNEGKIYIYNISLKNHLGLRDSNTSMDKNFNIRLNEEDNTDYEISFNVE